MHVGPRDLPPAYNPNPLHQKPGAPLAAAQAAPESPAEAAKAKMNRAKDTLLLMAAAPLHGPKKTLADLERQLIADSPTVAPKTVKEVLSAIEQEAASCIDTLMKDFQRFSKTAPFSTPAAQRELEALRRLQTQLTRANSPAAQQEATRLFHQARTTCLGMLFPAEARTTLTTCIKALTHYSTLPAAKSDATHQTNLAFLQAKERAIAQASTALDQWVLQGAAPEKKPNLAGIAPENAPPTHSALAADKPAAAAPVKAAAASAAPAFAQKVAPAPARTVQNCDVILSAPSGNCLYESIATSFNRIKDPAAKAETTAGLREWAAHFCKEAITNPQSPHRVEMCNRIHVSIKDYNDTLKTQFNQSTATFRLIMNDRTSSPADKRLAADNINMATAAYNSQKIDFNEAWNDQQKLAAYNKYADLIMNDTFWGGSPEIYALSQLLHVNIKMMNAATEHALGDARGIASAPNAQAKTIYLDYNNQDHYNAVIPNEAARIGAAALLRGHVPPPPPPKRQPAAAVQNAPKPVQLAQPAAAAAGAAAQKPDRLTLLREKTQAHTTAQEAYDRIRLPRLQANEQLKQLRLVQPSNQAEINRLTQIINAPPSREEQAAFQALDAARIALLEARRASLLPTYTHKTIPGDGNCLFESMAAAMNETLQSNPPKTKQALRQETVEYIRANLDKKIGPAAVPLRTLVMQAMAQSPERLRAVQRGSNPNEQINLYLDYMKQDKAWGGTLETTALALKYGFRIVVTNTETADPIQLNGVFQGGPDSAVQTALTTDPTQQKQPTIYLDNTGSHYDVWLPAKAAAPQPIAVQAAPKAAPKAPIKQASAADRAAAQAALKQTAAAQAAEAGRALTKIITDQLGVAPLAPAQFKAALDAFRAKYKLAQSFVDQAIARAAATICRDPAQIPRMLQRLKADFPGVAGMHIIGAVLADIEANKPKLLPGFDNFAPNFKAAFYAGPLGKRYTAFQQVKSTVDQAVIVFLAEVTQALRAPQKDFPQLRSLMIHAHNMAPERALDILPRNIEEAFHLFFVFPEGAMNHIAVIKRMAASMQENQYQAIVQKMKTAFPQEADKIVEFDLNVRYSVNPAHFKLGTHDIQIPPKPAGVQLEMLLTLCDEIDFRDSSKPNYIDPETLNNPDDASTGDPAELRKKLTDFIGRLKSNTHFMGFPENPALRKELYTHIENALTHVIQEIRKMEKAAATPEEREKVQREKAKMMKEVLGAAPHCGPREISMAVGQFKAVVKKIQPSFDESTYELLSNQRTTAFEALVKAGADHSTYFQHLMHDYGEAYGIPGAAQIKKLGKTHALTLVPLDSPQEVQRKFDAMYTPSAILSNVRTELRMKLDLRDAYVKHLIENVPADFEKATFQKIKDEVAAMRKAGASYPDIIKWLLDTKDVFAVVPKEKTDAAYAASIQRALDEERVGHYRAAMTLDAQNHWDLKPEGVLALLQKKQAITPLQFKKVAPPLPPLPSPKKSK